MENNQSIQDKDIQKPKEKLYQSNFKFLTFSKENIIEATKAACYNLSPLIEPKPALVNTVYIILKSFFQDGKRFVIAECPTGSGKTIIGFCVFFAVNYLVNKSNWNLDRTSNQKENDFKIGDPRQKRQDFSGYLTAYYLTSNKLLQNQIDNDINRFSFGEYMKLLKGVDNYVCLAADKEFKNEGSSINKRVLAKNSNATFASYSFRPCTNYSTKDFVAGCKYSWCYPDCPYKNARSETSAKPCAILNYAYFLNIMRNIDGPIPLYFYPRLVTICDEAHLIGNIVTDMCNIEFTNNMIKRVERLCNNIINMFGSKGEMSDFIIDVIPKGYEFFNHIINKVSEFVDYIKYLTYLKNEFIKVTKLYNSNAFEMMFSSDVDSILESLYETIDKKDYVMDLLYNRTQDVFYTSEASTDNKYKHILKDINESNMIRTNFINKLQYGLFMSATIGNIDEYAKLMGIKPNEYQKIMLPSTFDFSKSPIYLCNSGFLDFRNIELNLDKVLNNAIEICDYHKSEKGLIHTSTFKILTRLKEKVSNCSKEIFERFIFYNNVEEKNSAFEKFTKDNFPYILVGPSLYEGIDLPDDKCRFQILIKAPYAQINDYIRKKMERYPFWYKRNCIEKMVQAIGRSNRHPKDYSIIYLLDSCFNKLIGEIPYEWLVNRVTRYIPTKIIPK